MLEKIIETTKKFQTFSCTLQKYGTKPDGEKLLFRLPDNSTFFINSTSIY